MTHLCLPALALTIATLVALIPGCGPSEQTCAPRPHAVQCWDMGDLLRQRKQVVVDASRRAGATQEQVALVMAMLLQETQHAGCDERDASKDSAGDAKNWSAFNLNSACLKTLGWVDGRDADLNQDGNLGLAVGWVLKGFAQLGEDGMMDFHRGGSTAYADHTSYGAPEYRAQMRAVQAYLLANPDMLTNSQRVGGMLEHV